MDRISVVLGEEEKLSSVGAAGSFVRVFAREAGEWRAQGDFPSAFGPETLLPALRAELAALAEKLGDAKVLVGRSVGGLTFQVFDRLGFQIVEAEQFTPDLLDRIAAELEAQTNTSPPEKEIWPKESDIPDVYTLDLISLQLKFPEISSKMALQPFFKDTPFVRLTVLCRHLPPWILPLAKERNWEVTEEPVEDGAVRAVITPSVCR